MFWIGFTEEPLEKVEPQEQGRVGLAGGPDVSLRDEFWVPHPSVFKGCGFSLGFVLLPNESTAISPCSPFA